MDFEFEAEVFEWRGPAPFFFAATPAEVTIEIDDLKHELTYGWGMIPATVTIGSTTVKTALTPKNGSYYVPLKDSLRRANAIALGDRVRISLRI
jgi:hypothetical protein